MKSLSFLLVVITFTALEVRGQANTTTSEAGVAVAAGTYRGSITLDYFRTWKLGQKRRIGIGVGARFTGFLGTDLYYITAPARITSGSTSPLIFFKENIEENIDSFLIKSPQVNFVNLAINIDYQLSKKIVLGFNIDAIGFSFGKSTRGNYINGQEGKNEEAKPTAFNILLISDNDRGSLNSEIYAKYLLGEKLSVKVAAQFLFTEYTTNTKVQQLPEENDRFRNKSLLFSAGVTYRFR